MSSPSPPYPQSLLLRHFVTHLSPKGALAARSAAAAGGAPPVFPEGGLPFVKKWLVTRHATVFRLSNRAFQVAFNDGTEVLLSSDTQALSFLSKAGVRREFELGALPAEEDLMRRLRYTRELLAQIVGAGAGGGSSSAAAAAAPQQH